MPAKDKIWLRAVYQAGATIVLAAVLAFTVNLVRPDGIPLVGDWSHEGRVVAGGLGDEGLIVSLDEASALHSAGLTVFLDARPLEAFESGHIAGARSLPWQDFDSRFSEVMADIPPDASIITYCDGEACSLSKDLARELANMGYTQVRVLVNGWSVWKNNGLPIEP